MLYAINRVNTSKRNFLDMLSLQTSLVLNSSDVTVADPVEISTTVEGYNTTAAVTAISGQGFVGSKTVSYYRPSILEAAAVYRGLREVFVMFDTGVAPSNADVVEAISRKLNIPAADIVATGNTPSITDSSAFEVWTVKVLATCFTHRPIFSSPGVQPGVTFNVHAIDRATSLVDVPYETRSYTTRNGAALFTFTDSNYNVAAGRLDPSADVENQIVQHLRTRWPDIPKGLWDISRASMIELGSEYSRSLRTQPGMLNYVYTPLESNTSGRAPYKEGGMFSGLVTRFNVADKMASPDLTMNVSPSEQIVDALAALFKKSGVQMGNPFNVLVDSGSTTDTIANTATYTANATIYGDYAMYGTVPVSLHSISGTPLIQSLQYYVPGTQVVLTKAAIDGGSQSVKSVVVAALNAHKLTPAGRPAVTTILEGDVSVVPTNIRTQAVGMGQFRLTAVPTSDFSGQAIMTVARVDLGDYQSLADTDDAVLVGPGDDASLKTMLWVDYKIAADEFDFNPPAPYSVGTTAVTVSASDASSIYKGLINLSMNRLS